MDQPNTTKTTRASPETAHIRKIHAVGIPYHHLSNRAVPPQEDTHLPTDLSRHVAEMASQLRRHDLLRFHTPAIGALQRLPRRRLDAQGVAVDGGNRGSPAPAAGRERVDGLKVSTLGSFSRSPVARSSSLKTWAGGRGGNLPTLPAVRNVPTTSGVVLSEQRQERDSPGVWLHSNQRRDFMPYYEYRCQICDQRLELQQAAGEVSDGIVCPKCGSMSIERLPSGTRDTVRIPTTDSPSGSPPDGSCCGGSCGCGMN